MKSSRCGSAHFIKLDKEEDVLEQLSSYINENNVRAGVLSAIGVLKEAELGYYDLGTGKYITRSFEDDMELLSLSGNVAVLNGQLHPHVHVVLGGPKLDCVGGHLLKAKVGITCELFITQLDMKLERMYDDKIKLNLLTPSTVEVKK